MKKIKLFTLFIIACACLAACNSKKDTTISLESTTADNTVSENSTFDGNTPIDDEDVIIDNPGNSYSEDDELPVIPGIEEESTIAAEITDDGIEFVPTPNTDTDSSGGDNSQSTDTPIKLTFPTEFDAKSNNTSDIYLIDVDDDDNPDVVMNVNDSTALIWIYDSTLKEYVYNEELSRIPENSTENSDTISFEGLWSDSNTEIEIINDNSVYTVIVSKTTDSLHSEWLYYCELSGTSGNLESYGDATRTDITFDADGDPTQVSNKYTNGSATFSIDADGALIWNDAIDNEGANTKYTKN